MNVSRNTQYLASFLLGVGSILNVGAVFAEIGNVGTPKDDYNNLKKDWASVGSYLYKAMGEIDNGRANSNNGRR